MEKTIYALGFFDGVHLGHQALLRQCRRLAREQSCKAGVVTFGTHPDAIVTGDTPALINTARDREALLRRYGIETVVTLPFDERMHTMPWQEFLAMLAGRYGGVGFVCGEDFRFGYRGAGDAEKLSRACRQRDLPAAVVPDQMLDGIRVSSTHIRGLIEAGDMAGAVRFLGHPHILTGRVIHGRSLGHRLGIPTANLTLPEELAVPRFGVYACRTEIDGTYYSAVTNVGTRPTVDGVGIRVEPWILDYDGDLYGHSLTLAFYDFLRPERKFPSLEALKDEIHANARQTRAYFA